MKYAPLIAMFATACLAPPPGWTVSGGTEAQQAQALALVTAARDVSGLPLSDGSILLVVAPAQIGTRDGRTISGLSSTVDGHCAVDVLVWPERGLGPDLLDTAIGHELAHCIGLPQEDADKYGERIVEEYRRVRQGDRH
jgi:hypothetical protein